MATQRIDGKTPSGGEYAIVVFYDDDLKETDKENATKILVKECDKDGNVLKEMHLFKKKKTDD